MMPAARVRTRSILANIVARVSPKQSHAPDLINASSTLRLTVRPSTRSHNSASELNLPALPRRQKALDRHLADAFDGGQAETNGPPFPRPRCGWE